MNKLDKVFPDENSGEFQEFKINKDEKVKNYCNLYFRIIHL